MKNLSVPDPNQSAMVDARREIDLRLGIAFSRLQTAHFRDYFKGKFQGKPVTYGPCQTPTLWFCVKRHCEIDAFRPVSFWMLKVNIKLGSTLVECTRTKGEYYDGDEAERRRNELRCHGMCTIKNTKAWTSQLLRPLPLNTVALLKLASEKLAIGPGDAIAMAEKLYLAQLTSYPRTETDKYPENFDIIGTL